jgi:hypothetical protein
LAVSGVKPHDHRRYVAHSLSAAAVLLATIGLSWELLQRDSQWTSLPLSLARPVVGRSTLQGPLEKSNGPAEGARNRFDEDLDRLLEHEAPAPGALPMPSPAAAVSVDGRKDKKREQDAFESVQSAPLAVSREHRARQLSEEAGLEGPGLDHNRPELVEAGRLADEAQWEDPMAPEKAKIATFVQSRAHARFDHSALPLDFLGHYRQTSGLMFQPPTGYWANTYVPGDPEIRLLDARLAEWDRSWLPGGPGLERSVEAVSQPFDTPSDNALALSLMSDVSAITRAVQSGSPTRLRLQVGVAGIEHRRGQRPAMNVGVVVDLPPDTPDEQRIAVRALLDALLQSRQAGDRFSLVVAGSGLIVEATDFRFGSLRLAQQQILEPEEKAAANPMTLFEAVRRAGDMVRHRDDPGRPMGSSSVLLISAGALQDIEALTGLVHEHAREGVTLSAFPLGGQIQSDRVDRLVLAGLGHRRYLETPAQARALVEEELHASSRAVARAARLSIRLAPGVRLIGVVGSERLDSRHTRRVREIERGMDRRLSDHLGILSDRGDDEEGIQMVIPGIYSGDKVVVLLDVVTDRPGAIAEVSLRYKDLVFLRNGSLQAQLELSAQGTAEAVRGPAQLSVLKNLMSHHFSEAVEQAATALGGRQPGTAVTILQNMHTTIGRAREALPDWSGDPDLIRDQEVLEHYIAALVSPGAGAHRSILADSLRYAAWAKTHRPLTE